MNQITQRVNNCFANVFPDLRPEDAPRVSTASFAKWDSVAHVTLLSSIAEEFGIELEMSDFEELTSYALIVDFLEQKQQ